MGLLDSIVRAVAGSAGRKCPGDVELMRRVSGNPFAMPTSPEQDSKLEDGNELKRAALVGAGVDVSPLTEEKVSSDARAIANGLCGAGIRVDKKPQTSVKWQNLTKAGKVPKKVAEGLAIFDWKNGDSVIAHVWYTSAMEPYAADVHVWGGSGCHSYTIRTVDGAMAVQHDGVLDTGTDYYDVRS